MPPKKQTRSHFTRSHSKRPAPSSDNNNVSTQSSSASKRPARRTSLNSDVLAATSTAVAEAMKSMPSPAPQAATGSANQAQLVEESVHTVVQQLTGGVTTQDQPDPPNKMAESSAWARDSQDEKSLENLEAALQEMPRNMSVFSVTMRSLYVEKAVDTNESAARKFRKLRDDTRNDAMVYLQHILPMSHKLVTSIQGFFEYYTYLNYDEWIECLPDILKDVQGYRQLCEAAVKMHESIIVPLKKREDQAKLVMAELTDLQEEFEKRKKELEDRADQKEAWIIGLLFIPIVNAVACPLLEASADIDIANAVATGAQAKCQESAALAISEFLIPALKYFIKGLEEAAGFFKVMENELCMFADTGEHAQSKPAKHHYLIMKGKSTDIKDYCQMFASTLPSITTDFKAIPTEGTDQNYIDQWLAKQVTMIKKTCTTKIVKEILSAIKSYTKPK